MPSDLHYRSSDGGSPPPPPPPKPNQKVLSLILKIIIMTFITSVFVLLLGLASIFTLNILLATAAFRHSHRRPVDNIPGNSRDGISPIRLNTLSQFKCLKEVPSERDCRCVVCLDAIKQGQWCRRLADCGHVFHRKCVDVWLLKVASCPICRTPIGLDSQGERETKRSRGDWPLYSNNNSEVC